MASADRVVLIADFANLYLRDDKDYLSAIAPAKRSQAVRKRYRRTRARLIQSRDVEAARQEPEQRSEL